MSFTIQRALLSVSDKTGLVELAQQLIAHNVEILSTGGTAQTLRAAGINVIDVGDYTGFPEILDGRVKTLHPKIHAGILARRAQDKATLAQLSIPFIDLVVVNLYPFAQTVAKPNCLLAEAIEQIDIGGPSLLRGSAKNYHDVAVVVDPQDYTSIIEHFTQNNLDLMRRLTLAQKAFAHTAHYDALISEYLNQQIPAATHLPNRYTLALTEQQALRYGENPHQAATFYQKGIHKTGLAASIQYQGKPLSYNNLLDADAAMQCVQAFTTQPTCVIVKHTNPCGVASADTLLQAYQLAYQADSSSAFGGIIALNQPLDFDTAQAIIDTQFVEVILAPGFSEKALQILHSKPNVRALNYLPGDHDLLSYRSISGGLLVQENDMAPINSDRWQIVTKNKPTATQMNDLIFAWNVVRFVKSNAIVYAKNNQTLGIGAGQTSRIMSCEIGILKAQQAGLSLEHCVLASDAFFPFADSIEAAAKAGVAAIVQPGGSMRDQEVIEAADKLNIAMVFTGIRHFKH